ncbi:MAG: 2-C-methyl-D-erythritol 4-phosphate cytidylyltransferase [Candidatus Rokubacteria bacterium RIFCSPLOWO2_12_FULL_73_47]|nr:MAG: 2-C-methyl-D-erythritol 4-phosphate cytidylyltransferase [Candidatus Rokubacteria bacterium RIFCSPLOWO2_12_FULL_73_47]
MTRLAAVIPAGGIGARLGTRTPKQFLTIGRTPILAATVRHFTRHPGMAAVVVAAPQAHLARARRLLARAGRGAPIVVVAGGRTRQESVWLGLQAVPAGVNVVVVHDAVRPLITRRLVDDVVRAAREAGAAVCALPIAETVKRVRDGLVEATLDRAELWAVQTPQAFRADLLRGAHERARRDGIVGTDDAMLVERLGHPVRVVAGLPGNIKITTPEDLRRARGAARA